MIHRMSVDKAVADNSRDRKVEARSSIVVESRTLSRNTVPKSPSVTQEDTITLSKGSFSKEVS
jgi:hypothetical protein